MKYTPYIFALMLLLLCGGARLDAQVSGAASNPTVENLVADAAHMVAESRFADAIVYADKALAIAPQNDAARYYRGLSLVMTGKIDSGIAELHKATELDPNNFWYRYRLARMYDLCGEKSYAIETYEKLLEDFPKKSDLYFGLIELYTDSEEYSKALATLDKIETEFGKNENTAMARFDLLGRDGKQREAYESLEKFNNDYSSPAVLTTLADYQLSMFNDSTALAMYDEALELEPGLPNALLGKAEVYRITRRYSEFFPAVVPFIEDSEIAPQWKSEYLNAIISRSDPKLLQVYRPQMDSLFESLVRVHPKDSSALSVAGIYYYNVSDPSKAEIHLRKNAELYPDSETANAYYAQILATLGKMEELQDFTIKAWERTGNKVFLETGVGASVNNGDYETCLKLSKKLIQEAEDAEQRCMWETNIGDIYHQMGDDRNAFKIYKKVIKQNPDYAPALNNYAYYLCISGKSIKKAEKMSRRTVEQEPDNPTYLDTFGWILHLQGKNAEAKPVFKHSMLYGGKESAVILDHYAEVLNSLGETDLALHYWAQAKLKDTDGQVKGLDEKIARAKAETSRNSKTSTK